MKSAREVAPLLMEYLLHVGETGGVLWSVINNGNYTHADFEWAYERARRPGDPHKHKSPEFDALVDFTGMKITQIDLETGKYTTLTPALPAPEPEPVDPVYLKALAQEVTAALLQMRMTARKRCISLAEDMIYKTKQLGRSLVWAGGKNVTRPWWYYPDPPPPRPDSTAVYEVTPFRVSVQFYPFQKAAK